jgi:membrane protein
MGKALRDGHETSASAYGAGSAFIVILYVYYASTILYLGAEFTKSYAAYHGSRVEPSHYAVPTPGRGLRAGTASEERDASKTDRLEEAA